MIIVIILNFAVRNPGDKRPGGEFGNARENDYVAALDSHSGASASWNFLAIDRKSQQRAQIQIVENFPQFHFRKILRKSHQAALRLPNSSKFGGISASWKFVKILAKFISGKFTGISALPRARARTFELLPTRPWLHEVR
jgi:hypothetical protein